MVFSIIFLENTVPLYTQLSGEEPELLLSTVISILRDTMKVQKCTWVFKAHTCGYVKAAKLCSVKVLAATAAQWPGFALG